MAQTFALVQNVSPRVSQGNQMVVNAPKRYKMHQNMSSACFAPSFVRQSNGHKCIQMVRNAPKHEFTVAWGGPGAFVAKNPDTTLWHELLQYSSECCASSVARQPNGRKCTKTVQNAPKHEFRVKWGGLGAFVVKKIRLDFVARTFALVRPVLP